MSYGSGSIFKRGDIWYVQWFENGKPRQRSSKSKDRNVAMQLLHQIFAKEKGETEKITVGSLLTLVLEEYAHMERRSLYETKSRCDRHVRPWWGELTASAVTNADVKRYVQQRRRDKAENATINRELAIVRRGFTLGREEGLVADVPFVAKLPEHNVRQGFVENDQYRQLISNCPDHIRAVICVAYHTGIRRGELLSLRRSQVDLAAGLIRLSSRQTKNGKPRSAPIYGEMTGVLEMCLASGSGRCPYLFQYQEHRLKNFRSAWDVTVERAGMPKLKFHDLRRSAVRNMERAGIPRSVAMDISGHLSEAVYRRYDIVNERDIKAAGEKMAAYTTTGTPLEVEKTSNKGGGSQLQ